MKCQIPFSEKNKKHISKCRLLEILPRVLSVYAISQYYAKQDCIYTYSFLLYINSVINGLLQCLPHPNNIYHRMRVFSVKTETKISMCKYRPSTNIQI